jgi:glycosyltransferase involved in cell wall biosynthesis
MTIHVTIPAYNEAAIIADSLAKLFTFFETMPTRLQPDKVIVANNASTDATRMIVQGLLARYPILSILDVPEVGKGAAVLTAWQQESADVNVFFDADLATDLSVYPLLIDAIFSGADIAVGSRFARGARVQRTVGRRALSRGLRFFLVVLFQLKIQDAACGAKAVNRRVIETIVPRIRERGWSFDTELLIRAERTDYSIIELPVTWSDENDKKRPSHVSIIANIRARLRSLWRMRKGI